MSFVETCRRATAIVPAVVAGLTLGAAGASNALTAQPAALTAFGERMVGTWEAPDSRHVFEWGVGRQVVKSRSYAPEGDGWRIVSEGFWFWDPADEVIRGRTVAVDMGIDLFEFTTRVEHDRIVHDLVAHGEISGDFVELWRFDGDGYAWTLEQDGQRLMGGTYRRAR